MSWRKSFNNMNNSWADTGRRSKSYRNNKDNLKTTGPNFGSSNKLFLKFQRKLAECPTQYILSSSYVILHLTVVIVKANKL